MIQKKLLLLIVGIFIAPLLSAEQPQLDLNQSNVGHLPLIFEPNAGQGPNGSTFVARGVFPIALQSDRLALVFPGNESESASHSKTSSLVTLELMHSNAAAQSAGLNLLPGKSNYYIGADPRNWKTGIQQYSAVTFQSVYPGINVVYYGKDGLLEYDFVLSPGADPSAIKFRASGTKSIDLSKSGNLVLHLEQGSVELQKPAVYQKRADGTRQLVTGDFVLRGNEVSFRIGDYDKGRQLVVDPVLSFSTLIGANNQTTVSGVAADSSGDMYITGTTFATNYPTVNAF